MASPIPLRVATGPAVPSSKRVPVDISGLPTVSTKAQIVALTPIATADATDAATTQALANELKAKYNALLAALKA